MFFDLYIRRSVPGMMIVNIPSEISLSVVSDTMFMVAGFLAYVELERLNSS